MKAFLNYLLLCVWLLTGSASSFAMMSVGQISKNEAKELGVEVRFTGNGPREVWVELEFKPEGKFKDFSHVSLEIRDGDKLLVGYAPLGQKRPKPGKVLVGFMANREFLEKVSLMIVVGSLNDVGYFVKLKDFVEPAQEG